MKDGASWSALLGIKSVHLAVSVYAKTVPYTSLRKDAIAHKGVSLSSVEKENSPVVHHPCIDASMLARLSDHGHLKPYAHGAGGMTWLVNG